jgi:hypothetical protein
MALPEHMRVKSKLPVLLVETTRTAGGQFCLHVLLPCAVPTADSVAVV